MENLGAGIAGTFVLCFIISLIPIITFFVMAKALANISQAVRSTDMMLSVWYEVNGYKDQKRCAKCKKLFIGKPEKCPHCGDPKTY